VKLKYVYIFIPILLILGIYYVYDKNLQSKKAVPSTIGALVSLDPTAVSVVELKTGDKVVRISRDGTNGWRIDSPMSTPADNEAVDELFTKVSGAAIARDLGALGNASEYGLDTPQCKLSFSGAGGDVLLDFEVGAEYPATNGRYAAVDKKELYLLAPGAVDLTNVSFDVLRSHKPLKFDRDTIESFEVSTGDMDYVFKLDSGAWYLVSPQNFKASEGWCDGLLQMLERVKADEFITGPLPDGLEPLTGGIRLTAQDGGKHILTFLGLDKRKGIVASSPMLPQPFFTEFRVADYVNVPIDKLRETRLMMYTQSQIERVVLREVGGENLEFELANGKYKITEPKDRRIYKQSDFDDFFNVVLNIQAVRFVDEYKDLDSLGLEPYWIKIELYKSNNAGQVDLYIGGDTKDGYYANIDRSKQVFMISKEDINELIKAANKLRAGVAKVS